MGAQTFICSASGNSIQDAYKNAVENAIYSYGHEPYNGTISTTEGVVDRTDRLENLTAAQSSIDPRVEGVCRVIEVERAWEIEAYNHTEKYGACWGARVESGSNFYIFAGWANC